MVLPDDYVVHKIGMTHTNRSTDRMMEILRSWFTKYRFVPYSELRLDMECTCPKELEYHMHRILESTRFVPDQDVDGKTEMFCDINEVKVLHYLRNFNHQLLTEGPELRDEDYQTLCRLLQKDS